MNNAIGKLCSIIENSKMYDLNSYKYFVFPFKGIFPIELPLLEEIINLLKSNVSPRSTKIFTFMTDGIIVALPLAIELGKPLVIARDFHYNLSNVSSFMQRTNYFERRMYFTGVYETDRVEIVDAIISSGSTILSAILELEKTGCQIVGIHTVANKVEYGGSTLLKERGYSFSSLVDVEIDCKGMSCSPSPTK